jgi:hypothetical protein
LTYATFGAARLSTCRGALFGARDLIQPDPILAQNNGHWYHLLDLAAVCDTLIADNDSLHHLASSAAAGVERDESMNYMSTPMSC